MLASDYFRRFDAAASNASILSAIRTLEGFAREQPPVRLNLRVAGDRDRIHIDMADEQNRVIEISRGDWRIVNESPHKFRRTELTGGMSGPVRGGDLSKTVVLPQHQDAERGGEPSAAQLAGSPGDATRRSEGDPPPIV